MKMEFGVVAEGELLAPSVALTSFPPPSSQATVSLGAHVGPPKTRNMSACLAGWPVLYLSETWVVDSCTVPPAGEPRARPLSPGLGSSEPRLHGAPAGPAACGAADRPLEEEPAQRLHQARVPSGQDGARRRCPPCPIPLGPARSLGLALGLGESVPWQTGRGFLSTIGAPGPGHLDVAVPPVPLLAVEGALGLVLRGGPHRGPRSRATLLGVGCVDVCVTSGPSKILPLRPLLSV